MKQSLILVSVVVLFGGGAVCRTSPASLLQPIPGLPQEASSPTPQQQELDRLFQEGRKAAQKGDFPTALKAFETGLAQAQSFQNERMTAQFLANIGNLYYNLGQFERALDYHRQALELRKKAGNDSAIAASLANIGNVCNKLGQFDQALDYHQQALNLFEKAANVQGIIASCDGLGNVYYNLGQFDRALDFFQRELKLHKPDNEQNLAINSNNIGNVYYNLGQFDRALDFYQQALKIKEKIGNARDVAASLTNIGNIYQALSQLDRALACHRQGLELRKKGGNTQDIAESLASLANIYTALNQCATALDYHQQALKIREKIGNMQTVADSQDNIGTVYYKLSQYEQALDFYQKALKLREKIGNEQELAVTLYNIGKVYESLKQFERAQEYYARALTHFEAVTRQITDPTTLGAFQDTLPNLYARYARLLRQKPGGSDTAALVMLARGRAQGLTLLAAQARTDVADFFSTQDAEHWKAANDELSVASSLLAAADTRLGQVADAASATTDQKLAARKQHDNALVRLESSQRQIASLRAALMERYPRFKQLSAPPRPAVSQFKALAQSHPDTLFVEWDVVDEKTLLVFTLDHQWGVRGYEIALDTRTLTASLAAYKKADGSPGKSEISRTGGDVLTRTVEAWRDAIAQGRYLSGDQAPIGKEGARLEAVARTEERLAGVLYRALFGPLTKQRLMEPGRFRRLVVVGDGPLLNVPFAALRDGQGNRLMDRYALSSAVSLPLLLRPAAKKKPASTLLCAADPLGPLRSRPLASAAMATTAVERAGLGPLDHAREEAKSIVSLFPKSIGWEGPQASEEAIKGVMSRYQVLHFATHGVLDRRNGLRSWLALAESARPSGTKEDGRLEAREVVPMQLTAEMAVLSACDSGLGQRSGGEGLLGLAWGFQAAGCPSVVASLWHVNDTATRDLMVAFYTGLKAGKRKDEALRDAMRRVRGSGKDKDHAAPFFWAGFQIIGDSRPLAPAR